MRKLQFLVFCGLVSGALGEIPDPPRLAVMIVVDGLSQAQLDQSVDQLVEGGFRRFYEQGAWYPGARYSHATTVTAVGHASLMTGAHPYRHGLVGNDWYDRENQRRMYCVFDPDSSQLESGGTGVSARNLLVPTVGDELVMASSGQSRVVAVAIKDRSAVLGAGRLGQAYFYSSANGRFVSTDFYLDNYPDWWRTVWSGQPEDKWFRESWEPLLDASVYERAVRIDQGQRINYLGMGTIFPHSLGVQSQDPSADYYAALSRSPFGSDWTLEFVQAAVSGEKLGKRGNKLPDLLFVGFSSHDYINHHYGPESAEALDSLLRLDRVIERFFGFLEEWVGLDSVVVALSSDHGFAVSPEYQRAMGLDSARIDPKEMVKRLDAGLSEKFGRGEYTKVWMFPYLYLDDEAIEARGLSLEEVETAARSILKEERGVEEVFTRGQIESRRLPDTELARSVALSWYPERSGDLFVIQKSGWFLSGDPNGSAATHGSAYFYDQSVPLMFWGLGIKQGRYAQEAEVVDLAPTLALLMGVPRPSANEGRVLVEILKE